MATTIVGIFDDYTEAQAAVKALSGAGVKQGDIHIARNEPAGKSYTTYGGPNSKDYTSGTGIGASIENFFSNLFGANDDPAIRRESDIYAESVRRGSVAVAVNVEENMVDTAADILNRNGAVDIDRRAAQYRAAGYKNYDAKAPLYNAEQSQTEVKNYAGQGEVALPVIEEQLNIGKRVVQGGGVRVHTRVTERPVEEQVTLREENVTVNRRPVDREVSDADMKNFKDGDFTVTTQAEEAVVGKTSRVVEEVVVGKKVTEREETIRDTVRRTDVEVDEINAATDELQSRKARNS